MKKLTLCSIVFSMCVLGGKALAGGLPAWNDHAAPLTFLFGNDFDSHQQSKVRANGDLVGALYVHYSGVVTADGLPVASHADCSVSECSVGWTMSGKPREATFLYHAMDDHPTFLIDRSQIPQPGAYAHFHRVAAEEHSSGAGYMLQLFAVERFCFLHHDAAAAEAAKTCMENGGVAVSPGLDIATHLNIVTSMEPHTSDRPGATH